MVGVHPLTALRGPVYTYVVSKGQGPVSLWLFYFTISYEYVVIRCNYYRILFSFVSTSSY